MCDQPEINITFETTPRKKYQVNANKSTYYQEGFDDINDAIAEAAELVRQGFALVSIRDTEVEGDIW